MRILQLLPTAPNDFSTGGSQRGALMFDALSSSHEVDVAIVRQGAQDLVASPGGDPVRVITEWRPHFNEFGNVLPSEHVHRAIAELMASKPYDLVVSRFMMPLIKARINAGTPTLADIDDCRMRFSSGGSAAYALRQLPWRVRARAIETIIRPMMSHRYHYCFATPRDREEFADFSGSVLPNIPLPLPAAPAAQSNGERILLVAALGYGPNVRGIDRFIRASWPRIMRQRPKSQLRLVGRAPESLQAKWGRVAGVHVAGFVPDLAHEYASSALTICPIYEGVGSNIKILESFAYGRACVTTLHCARAFTDTLDPGKDIRFAATDREFADACIELLADRPQRDARAGAGQAVVRSKFTKERFTEIVHEAVGSALRVSGK